MGYAPLDFIKNEEDMYGMQEMGLDARPGHLWEDCYPDILKGFLSLTEYRSRHIRLQEFLEYVLRRDFLVPGRNLTDEQAMWDASFYRFVPEILETLGYHDMKGVVGNTTLLNELRDVLVENLILDEWSKNKQVLKPDPVFAEHLCATQQLEIREDTFDSLPFNTFYVDLEGCNADGRYGDALGIFVDIRRLQGNETAMTLYILREGNLTVSVYMNFDMARCPQKIDPSMIEDSSEVMTVPAVAANAGVPDSTTINPRLMSVLLLQLVNYMKVAKPDIVPSPEMKSTYRPKEKIKNKYSEIYKQEVGIRIGKTISEHMAAAKKAQAEQSERARSENRKPPVPHFRCAHWQRYWTGKGRAVCELRWIEPVFVCGSYSSDSATDVVVHDVK